MIVERLFATLRTTVSGQGIGVLLVEQRVNPALSWADRAYVLAGGRIRTSGTRRRSSGAEADVQASYLGS